MGGPVFNPFEELFAPGRKHTRDEQKRLELSREDVGDNDPGRGPIDLASGKVVIRVTETSDEEDGADEPQDQDRAPGRRLSSP
ncbi:DUF6191 domain-containing protein [Streptomyces sp. FB2]|uniref:DUF6191 domain-containing protein n=1 Tax=Streptomyces sp. FB2 TaxID=2902454 RepID=UPI001F44FB7F|nr:DUF6191 domain-containing protein [Streptomyces sp. FB2]MCF2540198.1 DUF6191 domain-containing protein [Streptomyces sp. FB2]